MNATTPANNPSHEPHNLFSTQVTFGEYYHLGDIDSLSTEIAVVCGGIEKCTPDYKVDRVNFKYYGIEYIVSGSCKVTLQGKEYHLKGGSMFCYGPHLDHTIENTGDQELIKYFIDVTGSKAPDMLWETFLKEDSPVRLSNIKWIGDIFSQFQECGKLGGDPGRELNSMLIKYLIERIQLEKINTPEAKSPAELSFEKVRTYIEKNFLTIKRMSEVAQACNISLPHICRLFKRFSNESPTHMLIRLKLEKAVEIISSEDYLIKEIADYVGFEDPFYFSHRFKQHFGVAPSNYAAAIKPVNQSEPELTLKAG